MIGKDFSKYSSWMNREEYENTGLIFLLFCKENAMSGSGARSVIEARGSKDPTLQRLMQNRRGGATEPHARSLLLDVQHYPRNFFSAGGSGGLISRIFPWAAS